jgi:Tetracyclin repressor-like, C-terminal domain
VEEEGQGRRFVTLAQAASGTPEVADALREFLTERVWANRPDGDSELARKTAALVSSQLLGVAWARYVVRMEPRPAATRGFIGISRPARARR